MTQSIPYGESDEAALLGAALLTRDAARLVTERTTAGDYWNPHHQRLRNTIAELINNGEPIDVATIISAMSRHGGIDNPVDTRRRLLQLIADCPASYNAPYYLEAVLDWSRRRQLLALADQLRTSAQQGTPVGDIVGVLGQIATPAGQSTWEPRDLADALSGEHNPTVPTMLVRTDGEALLYPGKVHAFNSSPGSGKSWLALHACAERLDCGEHVAYIDFEADASDIVQRLLELQVEPETIREQFHYIRPDEPFDTSARLRLSDTLERHPIVLAIIDGLAEALAQNDLDENSASDVTKFFTRLPRLLSRSGVTVVVLDHMVKDTEARGRYARGSTAKLAAIDGGVFRLDVVKAFNRDNPGVIKMTVSKDRHGSIKAEHFVAATIHITPEQGGDIVSVELRPVERKNSQEDPSDPAAGPKPTWYMGEISKILTHDEMTALSSNEVVQRVGRKRPVTLRALDMLYEEGYAGRKDGPRNSRLYYLIKPYIPESD